MTSHRFYRASRALCSIESKTPGRDRASISRHYRKQTHRYCADIVGRLGDDLPIGSSLGSEWRNAGVAGRCLRCRRIDEFFRRIDIKICRQTLAVRIGYKNSIFCIVVDPPPGRLHVCRCSPCFRNDVPRGNCPSNETGFTMKTIST